MESDRFVQTLSNDVDVLTQKLERLKAVVGRGASLALPAVGVGASAWMAQSAFESPMEAYKQWGYTRVAGYGMQRAGGALRSDSNFLRSLKTSATVDAEITVKALDKIGKGFESLGKTLNQSQLNAFNDGLNAIAKTGTKTGAILQAAFKPLGVIFNPFVQGTIIAIDVMDKFTKKAVEAREQVESLAKSMALGARATGEGGVTRATYEAMGAQYAGQLGIGRREALGYVGQVRATGFDTKETDMIMKVAMSVAREQGKNIGETLKTLLPQLQRVTSTMTQAQTADFLQRAASARALYAPGGTFGARPSFAGAMENAGIGADAFRGAIDTGVTAAYYAVTGATPGQESGLQRIRKQLGVGYQTIKEAGIDAFVGRYTAPIGFAGRVMKNLGFVGNVAQNIAYRKAMEGHPIFSRIWSPSQAAALLGESTDQLRTLGVRNLQEDYEKKNFAYNQEDTRLQAVDAEIERRKATADLNRLAQSGGSRREQRDLQDKIRLLDKKAQALGVRQTTYSDSWLQQESSRLRKSAFDLSEEKVAAEERVKSALDLQRKAKVEAGTLFAPGEAEKVLKEKYQGPVALSQKWTELQNVERLIGEKGYERERYAQILEEKKIAGEEGGGEYVRLQNHIKALDSEIAGLTSKFKSLSNEAFNLEEGLKRASVGEFNVRSNILLERSARFEAQRALAEGVLGPDDRKKLQESLSQPSLSRGAAEEVMKRVGIAGAEYSQRAAEQQYPIRMRGRRAFLGAEFADVRRTGALTGVETRNIGVAIASGKSDAMDVAEEILKQRRNSFEMELQYVVQYTQARMNVIKTHYDGLIVLEKTRLDEMQNKMRPAVELASGLMAGYQARMSTMGPAFAEQERRVREPRENRSIAEQKSFLGFRMAGVQVPEQVGWALEARAIREQEADMERRRAQERMIASGQIGGISRLYSGLQREGVSMQDMIASPEGAQLMMGAWQQAQPGMEYFGRGAEARGMIGGLAGITERYAIKRFHATNKMRQFEARSAAEQLDEMEKQFQENRGLNTAEGKLAQAGLGEKLKEARETYANQGNVGMVEAINQRLQQLTNDVPKSMKEIFNSKNSVTNTLISTSNEILNQILGTLRGDKKGTGGVPGVGSPRVGGDTSGVSGGPSSFAGGIYGRTPGGGTVGPGFNVVPNTPDLGISTKGTYNTDLLWAGYGSLEGGGMGRSIANIEKASMERLYGPSVRGSYSEKLKMYNFNKAMSGMVEDDRSIQRFEDTMRTAGYVKQEFSKGGRKWSSYYDPETGKDMGSYDNSLKQLTGELLDPGRTKLSSEKSLSNSPSSTSPAEAFGEGVNKFGHWIERLEQTTLKAEVNLNGTTFRATPSSGGGY